ncbi:MAG: phosphorylase, partial [Burkholderiales bacterium]
RYRTMLEAVGVREISAESELRQSAPYNLLVTRHWILLIPRSREHFDSISVNALGFAGSFFVRNERQMQAIKQHGPMAILRDVACPR